MGKTQTGKKSSAKTPPSRAAKTWRSPTYHNMKERKRGSGPVGRGGKVLADKQSLGGKGNQSGGVHILFIIGIWIRPRVGIE